MRSRPVADHGSPFRRLIHEYRGTVACVFVFSAVVNLLMLAGPLYMLQVYDRVLVSRSVPTLVALSVFLLGAYAFQGVLDLIRARIIVRSAMLVDARLAEDVHRAVVRIGADPSGSRDAAQPVRDLDQIRGFMSGSGPAAIMDLPWMPVFMAICFLIHSVLGWVALSGGLMLLGVTLLTERASRRLSGETMQSATTRLGLSEATRRNAETVTALGMEQALSERWAAANERFTEAVRSAADVVTGFGVLSKILRLLLQSALLGVGAYLVIGGELLPGAMIAASVMMGRALAPIETVIANWRGLIGARQSARRLSVVLEEAANAGPGLSLPPPLARLDVENLSVALPSTGRLLLKNIRFMLRSGEILGVIGSNGAGKTTLARALVGIWPPAGGYVRLDGATLDQWPGTDRGRHMGYVPQGADLFDGTIAENISRMETRPDDAAILKAAKAAGIHDMILRLPEGYETRIGRGGLLLSAGQRQRIALARALYRDPFLIVLDEPNANLDQEGETALDRALRQARERGAIVVVIAHRPSALALCDKLLVLADGSQKAFGPREDILRKVVPQADQAGKAGRLRVVPAARMTP